MPNRLFPALVHELFKGIRAGFLPDFLISTDRFLIQARKKSI